MFTLRLGTNRPVETVKPDQTAQCGIVSLANLPRLKKMEPWGEFMVKLPCLPQGFCTDKSVETV